MESSIYLMLIMLMLSSPFNSWVYGSPVSDIDGTSSSNLTKISSKTTEVTTMPTTTKVFPIPTIQNQSSPSVIQRKGIQTTIPIVTGKSVYRFRLGSLQQQQLQHGETPTKLIYNISDDKNMVTALDYSSKSPKRIVNREKNSLLLHSQQQSLMASNNRDGVNVGKNNEDKNWLLTKAWLIDNINKLRREMSNLERDYSQHLDSTHRDNVFNQKQLTEDVAKLRADHQFLSQQQKQILYLIKKNNHFKSKESKLKFMKIPDSTISYINSNNNNNNKIKPVNKRDITMDSQSFPKEKFTTETRRNMKEVFTELSSLHDISLILFDNIKNLERKIDIKDKLLR